MPGFGNLIIKTELREKRTGILSAWHNEPPRSALGAVPAVGRDIEYDAVGVAELMFGIGRRVAGRSRVVLAAMRFDRLLHRIDVVHSNAESAPL